MEPSRPLNHEEALVRAFVSKDKRDRYLMLLSNPKRRCEAINHLNHHFDFIESLATKISATDSSPNELEALLRSKGAGGTCQLIADESNLDGREISLREGCEMNSTEFFAFVLSCVPGQLAYFKMEADAHGYILQKRSR